MSHLLGLSFDTPASPSITLKGGRTLGEHTSGWGFGWYPGGEQAATVVKDPMPLGETAMTAVLRDWDRFRGTLFICHLRGAAKRATQEDTHPFTRSFAARDWTLAHSGNLDPSRLSELPLDGNPALEPVGHTDSEHVLCWLLAQIGQWGVRRLADVLPGNLHQLLSTANQLGTLNLLFSDGYDLVAYHDQGGADALYYARRTPPHPMQQFESEILSVALDDPRDVHRSFVLVTSEALGDAVTQLQPGQMLIVRRGAVVYDSLSPEASAADAQPPQPAQPNVGQGPMPPALQQTPAPSTQQGPATTATRSRPKLQTEARVLLVRHETVYSYAFQVERSSHLLRLRPTLDDTQTILEHTVTISPEPQLRELEDVFGNHLLQFDLDLPYNEFRIEAVTRVRLHELKPLYAPTRRTTIPLMWMPWQRQMMWPYLMPPELPESHLRELSDYAMSFVERQGYDLLETLLDMNRTIYNDFQYVGGSTTLATTPFDVYGARRGVCQDFANLFICLSRLLGVPARYRVGYIFTGANYQNQIQSEASHAWAEVYIPWHGWHGFDPTNGIEAGNDHVRVAVGRNYRDATPTSGTIFRGGGNESLRVSVSVEEVQ